MPATTSTSRAPMTVAISCVMRRRAGYAQGAGHLAGAIPDRHSDAPGARLVLLVIDGVTTRGDACQLNHEVVDAQDGVWGRREPLVATQHLTSLARGHGGQDRLAQCGPVWRIAGTHPPAMRSPWALSRMST